MREIKVSVLIYVLNNISYIEPCVRSVMKQTMKELEILIIDGGSIDGTLDTAEKLAEEDSRIRIIHSIPGVGVQFNTGLFEARGKYIGICESDDYILPEMYEYQYIAAENNKLDILRADANHFFETGRNTEIILPAVLSKNRELYDKVINGTKDMRVLQLGINSFWSGLYRREFLLEQNIFMNETKGAAYQDTSFYFLAILHAKRIMLSKNAFYCYRLDNPNSSVNNPQKITMLIDEYHLLKRRLEASNVFTKSKEIYLSWKINGYINFYDSISEELRKEFTALMYRDLCKELESNRYLKNELSMRNKKVAELVEQSSEALEGYLGEYYKALNDEKSKLKTIDTKKKIIIFGNGELGKLVYRYLLNTNRNVIAYMDNNKELWGKTSEGILILEPDKAIDICKDAIYIVANEKYSDIMKKQLNQYGIKDKNIIVCSNYIFFVKHVLQEELKNNGDI